MSEHRHCIRCTFVVRVFRFVILAFQQNRWWLFVVSPFESFVPRVNPVRFLSNDASKHPTNQLIFDNLTLSARRRVKSMPLWRVYSSISFNCVRSMLIASFHREKFIYFHGCMHTDVKAIHLMRIFEVFFLFYIVFGLVLFRKWLHITRWRTR